MGAIHRKSPASRVPEPQNKKKKNPTEKKKKKKPDSSALCVAEPFA